MLPPKRRNERIDLIGQLAPKRIHLLFFSGPELNTIEHQFNTKKNCNRI